MSTILTAEFDTNEEIEDCDFKINEKELEEDENHSLEENSQDPCDENEEPQSIDVDQVPVGKVEFELTERKICKGEALLYPGNDEKVTTINELECEDTIDEEDCTFNAEAESQDCEDNSQENDEDCDEECEIDEENDEDLKNFNVVTKVTNGTEICKMKFKDVEAWKEENCPKNEENSAMEECSLEDEDNENEMNEENENEDNENQVNQDSSEPLNKICENYNEEADDDYNPIYNEDTLSDIECEEDQDREDDEDLKKPEIVYTNDEFCMIKQDEVPVLKSIVQDSREEMECC